MVEDVIKVCVMCRETIKPNIPYFEHNGKCVCDECAMRYDFHRVAYNIGLEPNTNETVDVEYNVFDESDETDGENSDMVIPAAGEIIDVPEAEVLKVEEV